VHAAPFTFMIRSFAMASAVNAAVLSAVVISSCAPLSSGSRSSSASADRRERLKQRADSLIARLLDTPGEFSTGSHVYVFHTNQEVLDDLAALELHAVPALIDCMSDARPSRVTYLERSTGRTRRALSGALCHQALADTYFFQLRIDSLMERVEREVGCPNPDTARRRPCRSFAYYGSGIEQLKQQQRVWRAYHAAFLAGGYTGPPLLRHTAVGCYVLRLAPTPTSAALFDTTRRLVFELDTLPLPGTVRPDTIRLTDDWYITGRARWTAHYHLTVIVSWESDQRGGRLSFAFGGSDSSMAGYQLSRRGLPGSSGKVEVSRVDCRIARSS
jgi:hypothetical protein